MLLDGACCDPLYRKAVRVSVGAALTVPFRQGGAASDLIRALREAGFYVVALSPTGDRDVASIAWPPRTALLVGAEGPGLARDILESVPTVAIRMAPGFDSLNVATAAGIALHTFRAASTHRPGD